MFAIATGTATATATAFALGWFAKTGTIFGLGFVWGLSLSLSSSLLRWLLLLLLFAIGGHGHPSLMRLVPGDLHYQTTCPDCSYYGLEVVATS